MTAIFPLGRGSVSARRAVFRNLRSGQPLLLALFLALGLPATAGAHEFTVGSLTIEHPWSRATPPAAKVAAGYLVIRNAGSKPDRLVSATADVAAEAQLHEMTTENGVMTMRKLPDGLEVPAGGSIALKPGSFHLMLMGLKQPLREGGTFHGTLTFDKAGPVDVEFEIEAMGATGAGDDEHTGGEGH